MILFCFSSKDAARLKKCLNAYAPQLPKNNNVFILTRDDFPPTELSAPAAVVSEKHFAELVAPLSQEINGVEKIFSTGYGGLRNSCLLAAASLGAHAVFFDDDTRPAPHCIARYEHLFAQGKQIVCGKYLGHAGGVTTLVVELVSTLEKVWEGKSAARLR